VSDYINLVNEEDFDHIPEPEWLIGPTSRGDDGILMKETLAALVADKANFKTFLAMDWALALPTNKRSGTDMKSRLDEFSTLLVRVEGESVGVYVRGELVMTCLAGLTIEELQSSTSALFRFWTMQATDRPTQIDCSE
jgi:hypothetical protein